MVTILLTNDDGVMSPGLWALRRALTEIGDTVVVAPERPRSATSMSVTFHKPLRISRVTVDGIEAHSVSGNPADCVSLGVNEILKDRRPDVVVAGINPGDNTSAQVVLTSGTVAAAIQAAILGLKAVAFSAVIHEGRIPGLEEYETRLAKGLEVARRIIAWVVSRGMPEGVDFFNVNFPAEVGPNTPIIATRLARKMFEDFIVERLDPRGTPYYWQSGKIIASAERGSDVHAVHVERAISITPMSLDLSAVVPPKRLKNMVAHISR